MTNLKNLLKQFNDKPDMQFKNSLKNILLANKYFNNKKNNIFSIMKKILIKPFVWLPLSGVVTTAIIIAILFQTSTAFVLNLPKLNRFNTLKVNRVLAQADHYYGRVTNQEKIRYKKIKIEYPETQIQSYEGMSENMQKLYESLKYGITYEMWLDNEQKKAKMRMLGQDGELLEEMVMLDDSLYIRGGQIMLIFMGIMTSYNSESTEDSGIQDGEKIASEYANIYKYEITAWAKEFNLSEAEIRNMTKKEMEAKYWIGDTQYPCSWDYEIKLGELEKLDNQTIEKRDSEYYDSEEYEKCNTNFQTREEENVNDNEERQAASDEIENLLGFGESPFDEINNQIGWEKIFQKLKDNKYIKYEGEQQWQDTDVYALSLNDGFVNNYYFSTDNYTLKGFETLDPNGNFQEKTIILADNYVSDNIDFSINSYVSTAKMENMSAEVQLLNDNNIDGRLFGSVVSYLGFEYTDGENLYETTPGTLSISQEKFNKMTITQINARIKQHNATRANEYDKINEIVFADASYYEMTPTQIKAKLVQIGIKDADWLKLSNKNVNEKLVNAGNKPLFPDNLVYSYSPEYVRTNQLKVISELLEKIREK